MCMFFKAHTLRAKPATASADRDGGVIRLRQVHLGEVLGSDRLFHSFVTWRLRKQAAICTEKRPHRMQVCEHPWAQTCRLENHEKKCLWLRPRLGCCAHLYARQCMHPRLASSWLCRSRRRQWAPDPLALLSLPSSTGLTASLHRLAFSVCYVVATAQAD